MSFTVFDLIMRLPWCLGLFPGTLAYRLGPGLRAEEIRL